FDKMRGETGLHRCSHIGLHTMAAQCDARPTAEPTDFPHWLEAGVVRQAQTADYKSALVRRSTCKSFIDGPGLENAVPILLKQPSQGRKCGLVIFDNQHSARRRCRRRSRPAWDRRSVRNGCNIEFDGEQRTFAVPFAGHTQFSAMEIDDRLGNRQPEPESPEFPPAFEFALVKGMEDSRQCFGCYPDPTVLHANRNAIGAGIEATHRYCAPRWCKFDGILAQIPAHLTEPRG